MAKNVFDIYYHIQKAIDGMTKGEKLQSSISDKILYLYKLLERDPYDIEEDALKLLETFVEKLNSGVEIPGYLGEAALEYEGLNIFPNTTEYVIKEILDLVTNGIRDDLASKKIKKGIIREKDIVAVVRDDQDLEFLMS